MAILASDKSDRLHRGGRGTLDEQVLKHYRALLYGLPGWSSGARDMLRTLGITSCRRREGVSTVASHLALSAAESTQRQVLLVDANLASPYLHKFFRIQRGPGLAEALMQPSQVAKCIQPSQNPRLSLLTAGRAEDGAARALEVDQLSSLLESLHTHFDLVIFDLPSGIMGNSTLRLASLLDGVLLVVEAERTRWELARQMKDFMDRANINLLGAVLNRHDNQPLRG